MKIIFLLIFIENPDYKALFDGNLDVETIIKQITLLDGRFDIICSGSLLGISYKRVDSFPVGFVERMELNSLDFEEFCWANGMNEEAISYLKEYFVKMEQVSIAIHNQMLEDGSKIEIIDGNLGVYKGAIFENIIADIFAKSGKKLYYFEYNSTLEIDFFIRYEKKHQQNLLIIQNQNH